MNQHQDRETPEYGRIEAAADWLLRLQDDSGSDEQILGWMRWCEADPANQRAFDQVEALWALSSELSPKRVGAELAAARRVSKEQSSTPKPVDDRPGFFLNPAWAGLAFATFAVAAVLLTFKNEGEPVSEVRHVLVAQPAELVHQSRLSDGSEVELASGSSLSVKYSAGQRGLELQSGEAFFTVKADRKRPFVVDAGSVRIRAIGTAFNVRRANDRVVVTVSEGTVDVQRIDSGDAGDGVQISAGGQVRWGGPDTHPVLATVNPSAVLGWRTGRLAYTDEPLGAIVADLNRYSDRPVRIDDEAIKALRFSGTLYTRSTTEWLQALPKTLPVRITEDAGAWLILPREGGNTR